MPMSPSITLRQAQREHQGRRHKQRELAHPEPGFYTLSVKSYGCGTPVRAEVKAATRCCG